MYQKPSFHYVTLLCFSVLVYLPILGNDFVHYWDDKWMVMNQYTEGGINPQNVWAILTEYFHGQYSPLNELMYLLLYTVCGHDPFAFHLASLLLHTGCVCFVYVILKRIFVLTNRTRVKNAPLIAMVAALIFAVHPMNVETVAWISASKILVYAFFYLAATYTFIRFLENKKIRYYLFTIVLFVLSFGGKEQAVSFPVWLLMLYWLLGYSLKDRNVWMRTAPFFVLAFVFGIITMLSNASGGMGMLAHQATYPLWQRLVLGCYSLFEYLAKFIFPYKLLYIYPFPMVAGEALPEWTLVYPVLMAVIAVTLWKYLSKWPVASGLLFFVVHLAFVLHILPLSRFAVIADRYIYLSGIGLAFIIAYYFIWLVTRKTGIIKYAAIGFFVCMISYFSLYSNLRSREWKDTDSIKRELRELIKQRDDYVPEAFEELMNEQPQNN